jgi:hypothetical protein
MLAVDGNPASEFIQELAYQSNPQAQAWPRGVQSLQDTPCFFLLSIQAGYSRCIRFAHAPGLDALLCAIAWLSSL